jgi:hypothetical protein
MAVMLHHGVVRTSKMSKPLAYILHANWNYQVKSTKAKKKMEQLNPIVTALKKNLKKKKKGFLVKQKLFYIDVLKNQAYISNT